ncbi:helix-turn-helix domain-containing protein [Rhizobium metallidurans]|uniref:CRP/FNR family transcriptional activator FtrB n=1 Tax=Rhizobium metallidurans TaxID=1265931 RepID=A0A7W6GC85_9HYPH|nr:CRP/FNR family transcriptional activator FtrB [Rhizobium metallidurans]
MRKEEKPSIRKLPLFRDIMPQTFDTLMMAAYSQNFPPLLDLFREGEKADFLHVVVEGAVELHAKWNGRETVMAVVRPVSAFILAACVSDMVYLMSARTLEKSRIIMLPAGDLRSAMRRDPDLAMASMNELAMSYRVMVRHAKNLKLRSARERLAAWILQQSGLAGSTPSFFLPLEKRQLATYLGITAESLSRLLRGLQPDGVKVDGTRIIITDINRLRQVTELDHLLDDEVVTFEDRVS